MLVKQELAGSCFPIGDPTPELAMLLSDAINAFQF